MDETRLSTRHVIFSTATLLTHLPAYLFLFRALWRSFKLNTSAIIFVIDSSDHLRLTTARTDLLLMLVEEELKLAPLLVFCNKQDIDGAMKPEYICEQLGLAGTEQSKLWHVQGCCASKGEGLMDGLSWYVSRKHILSDLCPNNLLGWQMLYGRNTDSVEITLLFVFSSPGYSTIALQCLEETLYAHMAPFIKCAFSVISL